MNKKIKATAETVVRTWYHKAYPTDDEWKSLETFTFMDLFNLLDNNYAPDFGDSILRERIFQELAEVMDADYNYVYDQWINSPKDINMTKYDFGILNFSDFQNGMSIRESAYDYKTINENWRSSASEEDFERFRNRYNELKGDTKRKHGWLYFPRSSEDIIANSLDKVADQVYDFIESHKQYFAPDSGIYNGKFFYIEKKFNKGMGRTRLCKIDPKTKTIHLTNVANRFDIKYLEESFPKYKIENDDKYSPWDRKSW